MNSSLRPLPALEHLVTDGEFPVQIAFSCSECREMTMMTMIETKKSSARMSRKSPLRPPEKYFSAKSFLAPLPTWLKEKAQAAHRYIVGCGKVRDKQQMMKNVRNLIYFRRDYRLRRFEICSAPLPD